MSKSPSLRRIQADIRELAIDPSDRYSASPIEDDMFEWHFTIRGADGTDFEGGLYHGRILLPTDYPFKPPNIVFLTPSGRFETGVKVCLSFSAHHPELWQPAWGIRLILEALISFLPTPADGAIGSLDWSPAERKAMAKKSASYCCTRCGPIIDLVPKIGSVSSSTSSTSRFQKEIAKLHQLQIENEKHNKNNKNIIDSMNVGDNLKQSMEPLDGSLADITEEVAAKLPEATEKEENCDTEQEVACTATPSERLAMAEDEYPKTTSEFAASVTSAEITSEQDELTNRDLDGKATETTVTTTFNVPTSSSLLTDPVIHAIIVLFLAISGILYRKILLLLEELRRLDDE